MLECQENKIFIIIKIVIGICKELNNFKFCETEYFYKKLHFETVEIMLLFREENR